MMAWGVGLADWLWMGVWVFALLATVWLIVRGTGSRGAIDEAMAILRSRFARGEITRDEFEQARAALAADGQHE